MTLAIMAIPLSQGLFALVDGEDFEELSRFKWYALNNGYTYYAVRHSSQKLGKRKLILMHRVVMNAQPREEIDHYGHYGLDNRKDNIRICTRAQNNQNQRPRKNTSSQFKGVDWHTKSKKWRVQIKNNNKPIRLGCFDDEIEAAKTYDKKAKELFGEFAHLNFGD